MTMAAGIANSLPSNGNLNNLLSVHLNLLQFAANDNDKRLVSRVLYYLPQIRRRLDLSILLALLSSLPSSSPLASKVLAFISQLGTTTFSSNEGKFTSSLACEPYILFLTALYLHDNAKINESLELFNETIKLIESLNQRYLDPLLARCFYFMSRSAELNGSLGAIHNTLMLSFRQSVLRQDNYTQAGIYNILLRMMLLQDQYEAAAKFINRSNFPENVSGANQSRFHYYMANILAIQGDYVKAKECLNDSLRKAPHGKNAAGFVQAVNKLLIVVQLLLGELPERAMFLQPMLINSLRPYFLLTQSVRIGDLGKFQGIIDEMQLKFSSDRTLMLIQRLHSNVLKAGIKRLAISYSRIPLADIQKKLCLSTTEDAEFVILKAIKSGIIEGEINHEEGFLITKQNTNPYFTTEAQDEFHSRITQMNNLYDDSLRSLSYPMGVKTTSPNGNKNNENENLPTEAELIEEYLDADEF